MISFETRRQLARLVFLTAVAGGAAREAATAPAPDPQLSHVLPNDNLRSAGTLEQGTLTLALRAGVGQWKPEGPAGPALQIQAFGEVGSTLTVPVAADSCSGGHADRRFHPQRPRHQPGGARPLRARRRRLPDARCGTRRDVRSAVFGGQGRDVSLLGVLDGGARPVPGTGRRVHRRSARSCRTRQDPRGHGMDEPDAAAAPSDSRVRRCLESVPRGQASVRLYDQRPVVAGHRAAHLQRRGQGSVAHHQPQFSIPPVPSARLLFRRQQPRERAARSADRSGAPAPGRDAACPLGRNDDDDVDAGTEGQLAPSLPHHGPRVAGPPPRATRWRTWRSRR